MCNKGRIANYKVRINSVDLKPDSHLSQKKQAGKNGRVVVCVFSLVQDMIENRSVAEQAW